MYKFPEFLSCLATMLCLREMGALGQPPALSQAHVQWYTAILLQKPTSTFSQTPLFEAEKIGVDADIPENPQSQGL
jgi:hypothetical protein